MVAVTSNYKNALSANGVSTLFINGKPAVINDLRKLRNPPSWIVIFLVVPFNKTPLFSEYLITFMITLISSFISVIPEPLNTVEYLRSILLVTILYPASKRTFEMLLPA